MTKGIYILKINNIEYIGKDSNIDRSTRYKNHLWMLQNNKHFNKHLQRAYNKYGELEYDVLLEFSDIDEETLNKAEMFYIDLFNTVAEGFNQTIGGDGVRGRVRTAEEIDKMSKTKLKGFRDGIYTRTIGESNGMNKLSESQVKEIIEYFYKADKTHVELSEMYSVDRATIGSIYTGARWSYLEEASKWLQFKNENGHKLRRQGTNTLLPSDVYEIKYLLKSGFGNAELAKLYDSSVMTIYRIKKNQAYAEVDVSKPHSYYRL